MTTVRAIAVAQTCPVAGDVQANLEEHVRLAGVAAAYGAQLVLYPELSLTGYELGLADRLAFAENDTRLVPLLDAASVHSITLIVGAPIRIGSQLYLGAFILAPHRSIEIYTKHYLGAFSPSASDDGVVPPAEATVFHAGDRNPLVRFGGNVAAVAVCADIGRATHPQQAASRGATIYLASMFVVPSDYAGDMAKLRRYAQEHSLLVAFANFGAPSGGLTAAGRSAIWSEDGEVLIQLGPTGSGVAVVSEDVRGRRVHAEVVMRS